MRTAPPLVSALLLALAACKTPEPRIPFQDPNWHAVAFGVPAWLDEFRAAITQGEDAVYANFLTVEPGRIRAAYPGATWQRLVALKRRYDPDNLFRRNANIAPA